MSAYVVGLVEVLARDLGGPGRPRLRPGGFVAAARTCGFTPHVAPVTHRASAIDGRTTSHAGYAVPVVVDGKPTAETMIIKRVDGHHVTNILKMNGKQFASSVATLSADGKTLTVVTDNIGGPIGKQTDVFIKQ